MIDIMQHLKLSFFYNCYTGGFNANYYGKKFEEKTNNQKVLSELGYEKYSFNKKSKSESNIFFVKKFDNKNITFVQQSGLKKFMKNNYNIDLFRYPDEAYIIEYSDGKKMVKILEKKEQNVDGSIETKLWAGQSIKREYEIVFGDVFNISYAFCVNNFLKNKITSNEKKYKILNKILIESCITVLFGDDKDYYISLYNWINNLLC
jgi:hypothetical protein